MIVSCWQIPNRSMAKAAKAIRHQIILIACVLAGRDDMHLAHIDITQVLDRCHIDIRKKHPHTFQLLFDPTLLDSGSFRANPEGTGEIP
jgi:hypothetical protein